MEILPEGGGDPALMDVGVVTNICATLAFPDEAAILLTSLLEVHELILFTRVPLAIYMAFQMALCTSKVRNRHG